MIVDYYNNLGIGISSIMFVLKHSETLSISKICLILPFVSHYELLNYLARKTTKVKSIEKIITDKTNCFTNFSKRYYDSLCLTLNSIQYLNDMEYIEFNGDSISMKKTLEYETRMGKRAFNIFKASENISNMLSADSEKLYLNLRVEL